MLTWSQYGLHVSSWPLGNKLACAVSDVVYVLAAVCSAAFALAMYHKPVGLARVQTEVQLRHLTRMQPIE